jgi:hypothetical protein
MNPEKLEGRSGTSKGETIVPESGYWANEDPRFIVA